MGTVHILVIKHLGGRGKGTAISLRPIYLPNEDWDRQPGLHTETAKLCKKFFKYNSRETIGLIYRSQKDSNLTLQQVFSGSSHQENANSHTLWWEFKMITTGA